MNKRKIRRFFGGCFACSGKSRPPIAIRTPTIVDVDDKPSFHSLRDKSRSASSASSLKIRSECVCFAFVRWNDGRHLSTRAEKKENLRVFERKIEKRKCFRSRKKVDFERRKPPASADRRRLASEVVLFFPPISTTTKKQTNKQSLQMGFSSSFD